MIPLRLHLSNFLSYGENAPVLDLEGIHVACLSGGNGQGKSALLDAMTWAIWGEARKSGESRKPDDELLRVGTRAMVVDFSFRIGGVDHRVVRSYTRSASGKTSKPGLEFQIRDGDAWRPLTAESVRATQAAIDERVGIDYETFINSTFLLQGRSDEFTKKKPGERKEILGKILALGRYDAMAARAGQRWSRLRERATALEAEGTRLDVSLEPVGEWEAERAEVEAEVGRATQAVEAAAAALAQATATLAGLDAASREATTREEALASLGGRLAALDRDLVTVAQRIETADALLARSEEIEADHARYEALRRERAALDEKAALFRGVDAQRHALRLEMQQQTAEARAEIVSQEGALATLDRQIEADTEAAAGLAAAEAAHARALAAVDDLQRFEAVATERAGIEKRIEALDKQLAADKGALEGTRARIVEEGKRLAAEVAAAQPVELDALQTAVTAGQDAATRREHLQAEGTEASRAVGAFEGRLQALAAERAAVEEKRRRLVDSEDDTCPTCGTDLSDAHRADVLAGYAESLQALADAQAAVTADRDEAVATRDRLRAEYVRLGTVVEAGDVATRDLRAARDRAERAEAMQARLEELRADVRRLQKQIDAEDYSPKARAERTELQETLAGVDYDPTGHAAARAEAKLLDHWARQVRTLSLASERLSQATADRTRRVTALADRRAALDRNDHNAERAQRMAALDAQVERLEFDPAEHERVGKAFDALADAPRRLAELLDARRQRAELGERRAARVEERARVERDRGAQAEALAALQDRLAARPEAERVRDAAEADRRSAAARLAQAQERLGALTERLAKASRDRALRTEVRAELKEVKRERALYGHLRRAFGKNGIPSLIIEETLPEIEARANALLERLSRGRTRVALETLKDKKTGGGTRETLDIRITDDQGVARAYETYSGGEAFRVNFALRIALSQILAERSGTQIRTLVIDEGFGTQDAEGLQRLIGAIRAIQDDFETILVITHLDELKAAFPVRIEVRKEPVTGSTFEVVGV
ncbi:hypothetical protein B1759_00970 [Rubrivirga sp. SAORIC476]|uniref:AAA family ATPase n=1 Tax=Rubrivirga sp. SAORIC476 TaxID=1961794 RepID=UPI000BA94982|nr:SMC family ATPase [Rubrivirga sp. SAORIC476]PAP82353.1 hypothetical protein B1759_00970 [Rubrivirga sp. SAORIC476]